MALDGISENTTKEESTVNNEHARALELHAKIRALETAASGRLLR